MLAEPLQDEFVVKQAVERSEEEDVEGQVANSLLLKVSTQSFHLPAGPEEQQRTSNQQSSLTGTPSGVGLRSMSSNQCVCGGVPEALISRMDHISMSLATLLWNVLTFSMSASLIAFIHSPTGPLQFNQAL